MKIKITDEEEKSIKWKEYAVGAIHFADGIKVKWISDALSGILMELEGAIRDYEFDVKTREFAEDTLWIRKRGINE